MSVIARRSLGAVAASLAGVLLAGSISGALRNTDDRLGVMSTVPARLALALTAPVTVDDDYLEVKPRIGIAVASGSTGHRHATTEGTPAARKVRVIPTIPSPSRYLSIPV